MKNKAFTLIETIVGITLMTVVLTSVTGLILSTLLANQRNTHSLQALALAQEGVEVMRFFRDSNWLQNYSWDNGLEAPATLYLKEEPCTADPPCWSVSAQEVDGEIDIFNRKVELIEVTDQEESVEVLVTVTWEDKGVERSVDLSTFLSNWK